MQPIVITGAAGTLGDAFMRVSETRALDTARMDRHQLDVTDYDAVQRALAELRPWAVINAAGYVRVDDAESDRDSCYRANVTGAVTLANVCATMNIPLVTFSSDLVFDGAKQSPYIESDVPAPLSVYGWSKHEAEQRVLAACPSAMVVRTSAFFGPWDDYNFATVALRTAARGEVTRAACDVTVSPTYLPDLVNACLDLLIDGASGVWHLSNVGAMSWSDLVLASMRAAGACKAVVDAVPACALGWRAARPSYSALETERGVLLPALDDALDRWARQI